MSTTVPELNTPYSIQIELVEGCPRLCKFCGLNGIREDKGFPFYYMSDRMVDRLIEQCVRFIPNRRYEFAMHGEPTLHPQINDIIARFRRALPKAQMMVTTNGFQWHTDTNMMKGVSQLFDAGLDFIMLDTYEPERDLLHHTAWYLNKHFGIEVVDFYRDDHDINPYYNRGRWKKPVLLLMDDLAKMDGTSKLKKIWNHAGNSGTVPALKRPLEKACVNPFREISVAFNGNVNICCMDFGHEMVIGNIGVHTLSQIWWGDRFEAVRAFLRNKHRYFTPCARCDYSGGMRVGLLPKRAKPTRWQRQVVRMMTFDILSQRNSLVPRVWWTEREKVK